MNYKKYAYDNQKKRGYEVIKIEGKLIWIKCSVCGAIRTIQLQSLYRNESRQMHNHFCSKYYLGMITKEYNREIATKFHDFYRMAHERCCNPNNKDYQTYKGQFKFQDFPEFVLECYPLYKEALKTNYYKELSIDRIDGHKGYEPGNIRFITMTENLRNKPYIYPVRATNTKTGEIIEAASFRDLSIKITGSANSTGTFIKNCKINKLYRNIWKIEYI